MTGKRLTKTYKRTALQWGAGRVAVSLQQPISPKTAWKQGHGPT